MDLVDSLWAEDSIKAIFLMNLPARHSGALPAAGHGVATSLPVMLLKSKAMRWFSCQIQVVEDDRQLLATLSDAVTGDGWYGAGGLCLIQGEPAWLRPATDLQSQHCEPVVVLRSHRHSSPAPCRQSRVCVDVS